MKRKGSICVVVQVRKQDHRVRYLQATAREAGSGACERRVRWIVSLRFTGPGSRARRTQLKRASALCPLTANCAWARLPDWETISQAIEWLDRIECYDVVYTSVHAAVEKIETLAPKKRRRSSIGRRRSRGGAREVTLSWAD